MENLNKEIILKKLSEIDKNKYGFSKIGLFGSYSKGEQTENSDIDILVEMEINSDKYEESSYFRFCNLKRYLEELFEKKVDLIDRSQFNYKYKCPAVKEYKDKLRQEILESVVYA